MHRCCTVHDQGLSRTPDACTRDRHRHRQGGWLGGRTLRLEQAARPLAVGMEGLAGPRGRSPRFSGLETPLWRSRHPCAQEHPVSQSMASINSKHRPEVLSHLLHLVLEPVTDGILSLASLARSAMSKVARTCEDRDAAGCCGLRGCSCRGVESAQVSTRIGAALRDSRGFPPAYAHHAERQLRTLRRSRCQLHDRSVGCHGVPVQRDRVS